MLIQRIRRRLNIKTTLAQRLVFAGWIESDPLFANGLYSRFLDSLFVLEKWKTRGDFAAEIAIDVCFNSNCTRVIYF